jgi:hypothetical protein
MLVVVEVLIHGAVEAKRTRDVLAGIIKLSALFVLSNYL